MSSTAMSWMTKLKQTSLEKASRTSEVGFAMRCRTPEEENISLLRRQTVGELATTPPLEHRRAHRSPHGVSSITVFIWIRSSSNSRDHPGIPLRVRHKMRV